ncbi:uncharacterized protein LOC135210704 [Macrobrachium nipponense]|uniref:uncharacterized protein LOC135210704 n=1 Tax=Macrobrachium nipponense TaxID=159736 RepID=UPI0030C7DF42
MRHLTKSTTLFPQRVHSAYSLSKKYESSGEFCKSKSEVLKKSDNETCQVPQALKKERQLSVKSSVTMPSKPCVKKSPSGGSKSSPKKQKILPVTSLKCFLCNKIIKTENLSEHLLFGGVYCLKCPVVFKKCQSFQVWTVQQKQGHNPCEHVLQYSEDPMESLELHLSNQYLENGTSCRASLIDKPHHLRAYVNGMNSMRNEFPWKEAVSCFKQGGRKTKARKGAVPTEQSDNRHSIHTTSDDVSVNSNELPKDHSQDINDVPVVPDTVKADDEVHISVNSELGNFTPTSDEQDQCVPSVTPSPSPNKNSPNKNSCTDAGLQNRKKKQDVRKRKRSEWISGIKKRTHSSKSNNSSVSYVETPMNGFYYVVRHAVSECPNCYAKISPPDFTVNIVTFLMTAVCADCSLTIYIVHDPPDDSSPRVCIVTDEEKRAGARKKTTASQRGLKKATIVES